MVKKLGYCLVLSFLVLMVSGCGKNELRCTKNEDIGKQIVTFNFNKKEEVESGNIRYEVQVDSEELEDTKETLEKTFKETFEEKGITVKVTDNGNNMIVITLDFKAENLNTAMGSNIDKDKDIKAIKKELESNNYTCKTS